MRQRRLGLGLVARAVYILWAIFCLVLGWLALEGYEVFEPSWATPEEIKDGFIWLFFGGLILFYALMWSVSALIESDTFQKWFKHGRGGSARWGGVLAFFKYSWWRMNERGTQARVFMGRTFHKYDPWPFCQDIGVDDKNHLVTIAQSRSGKSTTVIWPNLIEYAYSDSVFILDPKGEHALMTKDWRENTCHQRVYVLDPFDETKGQVFKDGFNPLEEIDPQSDKAKSDIGAIADACVIPLASKSGTDDHFEKLQRAMITGLIAHVLTTQPKEKHNLPAVYDYFLDLADEDVFLDFLDEMKGNTACGNAPREAVLMYDKAGGNEKGSIFTTTVSNISWIAEEGMRKHLLRSDFKLEVLRTLDANLYVVLAFDAMKPQAQGRYMRMLINLAFRTCRNVPLPGWKKRRGGRTLFILDEVAQLGPMPSIAEAYQTLSGYDVKIWTFFQNFGALKRMYPSPNDLMGNATKQFFGCNDPETAKEIESYLGQYLDQRQAGTGEGSGTYESRKPLLDANEIMNTLGQNDPEQIVITGEKVKYKMELKRKTFIPPSDRRGALGILAGFPTWTRLGFFGLGCLWAGMILFGEPFGDLSSKLISDLSDEMSSAVPGVVALVVPWVGVWLVRIWIAVLGFGLWANLFRGHKMKGPYVWGWSREERKQYEAEWELANQWEEAVREERRRESHLDFERKMREADEEREESERKAARAKPQVKPKPELKEGGEVRSEQKRQEAKERKRQVRERLEREKKARRRKQKAQERPAEPEFEEVGDDVSEERDISDTGSKAYKPKENAARLRFELLEGFTCEQLHKRLPKRLEKVAANEVDRVMEDYKILLACCA